MDALRDSLNEKIFKIATDFWRSSFTPTDVIFTDQILDGEVYIFVDLNIDLKRISIVRYRENRLQYTPRLFYTNKEYRNKIKKRYYE